MPPQQSSCSAATTLLQATATSLDQLQKYDIGSFQTAVNSVNATLTIDHKLIDQQQVQLWVILIETGAMTSVASPGTFPDIPLNFVSGNTQN
eukprot:5519809-Amphidinium_carterae.1